MGLLKLNKLEKMVIMVFDKPERATFAPKKYEVMFNPTTYSLTYENNFSKLQGINTTGRPSKFALAPPDTLEVTLIIDGTGVRKIGSQQLLDELFGAEDDVYGEVQDFLQATTEVNGKIHEPNFLRLEWGDLTFDCRLKKVKVSYTLFNRQGNPLRAELQCEFFGDLQKSKRLRKDNFSSPDLTHRRILRAGEDLLQLTEEIYGSPHYYLKVAAVNQLDNFRDLAPGRELFFPPVKDLSE
ncbi:MAG: hypothetical protein AAGN35_21525 [Bacteroidota bacterium]